MSGKPLEQSFVSPTADQAPRDAGSSHNPRSVSASPRDARGSGSRFVGDMNPESVFPQPADPGSEESARAGGVGRWFAQQLTHEDTGKERLRAIPASSLFSAYPRALQQIFMPILEEESTSTIPPPLQRDALCSAYLDQFQPVLPIVDWSSHATLLESDHRRLLMEQGMCLVASADPAQSAQLYLRDEEALLTCAEFGKRVLAAMRVSIDIGLVTDKMVLIQALCLMALYCQGRDDGDNASMFTARAVQHAITLGLHIPERDDQVPDGDHAETLFCCVWVVDRLHAALQGRTVLIHERDIARPFHRAMNAQNPVFRLLLLVVEHLDRVFSVYRPGRHQDDLQGEFNLFEDLILKSEASTVPLRQLGMFASTLKHSRLQH
jgi:hypothetical protein